MKEQAQVKVQVGMQEQWEMQEEEVVDPPVEQLCHVGQLQLARQAAR